MMSMDAAKHLLLGLVEGYLAGSMSGLAFVRAVDDLVGDDVAAEFPPPLRAAVEDLQDELALYVRDDATRRDSSAYFGNDELVRKVSSFRSIVTMLMSG